MLLSLKNQYIPVIIQAGFITRFISGPCPAGPLQGTSKRIRRFVMQLE